MESGGGNSGGIRLEKFHLTSTTHSSGANQLWFWKPCGKMTSKIIAWNTLWISMWFVCLFESRPCLHLHLLHHHHHHHHHHPPFYWTHEWICNASSYWLFPEAPGTAASGAGDGREWRSEHQKAPGWSGFTLQWLVQMINAVDERNLAPNNGIELPSNWCMMSSVNSMSLNNPLCHVAPKEFEGLREFLIAPAPMTDSLPKD